MSFSCFIDIFDCFITYTIYDQFNITLCTPDVIVVPNYLVALPVGYLVAVFEPIYKKR